MEFYLLKISQKGRIIMLPIMLPAFLNTNEPLKITFGRIEGLNDDHSEYVKRVNKAKTVKEML